MERNERAALTMILNEVKKLNCLQRENGNLTDQMKELIDYYQEILDSTILNSSEIHKSLVREIRMELLRLSILANPVTREMYRDKKKPRCNEGLICKNKVPVTNMPWIIESPVKNQNRSHYLTSSGFISLEPNGIILGELINPIKSGQMVVVSLVSGGGIEATTIELILDSKSLHEEELMRVISTNVLLNNKGSALVKLVTESINEEIEGEGELFFV